MPTDSPSTTTSFPIRLEARARLLLLAFGVRHGSAWLRLERDRIVSRFGFSHAVIPLVDIERWELTGPYRWWRALGIRSALTKPEITYGGSTHGGIRLQLSTPIRIAWINVLDFYVTVDDLDGLAAALTARGIHGEDHRRSA